MNNSYHYEGTTDRQAMLKSAHRNAAFGQKTVVHDHRPNHPCVETCEFIEPKKETDVGAGSSTPDGS